jgi:transcriptional regulator GlxA family with amidase domain
MLIQVIVFDGADELDFVGPWEVFRLAAAAVKQAVEVRLVTLAPAGEVVAAHGLRVRPDGVLADECDLVIVPGGGWVARSAQSVRAEVERGELPRRLARIHAARGTVAGVCTGAMAMEAAGLLKGRAAVTHHGAIDDLRSTGTRVANARIVDEGSVLTCGGVTSGIDLALHLVQRYWGRDLADGIARQLEYARTRDVHRESIIVGSAPQ